MKSIKTLALVVSSTLISACSWLYGEDGLIKDSTYEYVNAQQTKDITIPSTLNQKNKANYTPIPNIGTKAQAAPMGADIKISAPLQIMAVLDNIRENKKSTNPAIYIIEDVDFLWNSITQLFAENEANLEINDKDNLHMKTDWLAVDERGVWLGLAGTEDVDEFRVKFEIKFSEGVLRNEKQIEVTRVAAEKLNEDTDQWQSVPSFWQDSAEMLNLIISNYDKLAIERDKNKRNDMIAGFKVQLAKDDDGSAALLTAASLEIVWEKLPKVLEALEFDVNDRDRQLMTYFVKYEFEEPGFFASLFDDDIEPLPLESGDYQVTLREFSQGTAIVFRDGQGAPLDANTMVKLFPTLSKLFGNKR